MPIYNRVSNTPLVALVALVPLSGIFIQLPSQNTPCCNFPSFGQFITFIIWDIFFPCAVSSDIAVSLKPLIAGSSMVVAIVKINAQFGVICGVRYHE